MKALPWWKSIKRVLAIYIFKILMEMKKAHIYLRRMKRTMISLRLFCWRKTINQQLSTAEGLKEITDYHLFLLNNSLIENLDDWISNCIEGCSLHYSPVSLLAAFLKFLCQLLISDCLRGWCHLLEQFIEASESTDQTAFIRLRHFTDLSKISSWAPFISNFDQLFLDTTQILIFFNFYLTLMQNLINFLCFVHHFLQFCFKFGIFCEFTITLWSFFVNQRSEDGCAFNRIHIIKESRK